MQKIHRISKQTLLVKNLCKVNQQKIATSQQQQGFLHQKPEECDQEIISIIKKEQLRQQQGINLIASENHCSKAVLEALGSPLMIKYSDGYNNNRLYPGCEYTSKIEKLCQDRALKAFNLNPEEWGVNVQAYSGCNANFSVYNGLLEPHQRILGLDLPHGGHLSHGFQNKNKKISLVSKYFESFPYRLNEETEQIDYDKMEEYAELYNPKILIAGASAYSRLIDYERFKKVAQKVDAYLMTDMAHISGLVAAQAIPSPFDYSDIVTTTTHKSLRGPRGSLIFYRKGLRYTDKKGNKVYYDLEDKINHGVSPLTQNGPHNNQIGAYAVALKEACSQQFKDYQLQVLKNCQTFSKRLQELGYHIVSGGTDNHLVLINLKKSGLDGSRAERLLELLLISTNKNTVPGDQNALNPGGIRAGTPAMTSRGLVEKDFKQVADFIDQTCKLIPKLKKDCGGKKIKDFNEYVTKNLDNIPELSRLGNEIRDFSSQFPVPAIE
ncbi:Pyridoxal phosphate-dependent transferase [Pseudocohnilembus persalinus]|uniref:glycine hydroxymethyltransferase n=1 Tax=Pseudocohnilembus persalinus TaxID=266149 RepID=A0A0V0QU63_PSEPJ|nr:Pyridoxal phosphate-dependent transferase [Pseudocohnilembus persalinus]|eukprot:KRX05445.1 Pyridoxal phosphate-dependent transferase [Pseudocohnilembus persalinus]